MSKLTLGVFHHVAGVCPFMPTHAFYGLEAACLLLLRRVSLSRPHAGVMCGTGDITIQLYANELSASLARTHTHAHTHTQSPGSVKLVYSSPWPLTANRNDTGPARSRIEIKDLI